MSLRVCVSRGEITCRGVGGADAGGAESNGWVCRTAFAPLSGHSKRRASLSKDSKFTVDVPAGGRRAHWQVRFHAASARNSQGKIRSVRQRAARTGASVRVSKVNLTSSGGSRRFGGPPGTRSRSENTLAALTRCSR